MATLKAKPPCTVKRRRPKILISGDAGVGKTYEAMRFPGCYYMDHESGGTEPQYQKRLLDSGGVYFGVEDGSLDFDEVIGQYKALGTVKHAHKTIVHDSITKLYQTAIANEQERLGSKDQFGASKRPAVRYMRQLVNWLNRIDMNVILIAHRIPEWGVIDGERKQVGYTFDCWETLKYDIDIWLEIDKSGPKRTMRVRKSRPTGLEEGKLYEWSYEKFAELYGIGEIEAAVEQVSLVSKENAAEIERLFDLLKIEESKIDKILAKCKADSIDELTPEQADETLVWLNKKLKGEAA